ncbi:MAG: protein-disulfide reductase DsbD [Xanthomonadales bacterium]|nr:protein-disulfide reductase DsbD [Xanthomonadales bacterium]MBK7146362.1 protein-disulfide reductase DsbD [Xanthomonadales bacterium]
MNTWLHWPRILLTLLALTGAGAPVCAIAEKDLLAVDDAFRLEAEAVAKNRVEFRWKIAPGYYLYKERIKVALADSGSFAANPLQLPAGEVKEDQFFGRMETYRGSATATLSGTAAAGVELLRFKVSYQGCADAGVCYPPQRKEVVVSLPDPARTVAAKTAVEDPTSTAPMNAPAPTPADAPVTAMPLVLPGTAAPVVASAPVVSAPAPLSLPGTAAPSEGVDALPLPEEEAFQVETIALSGTELLARFSMPKDYYLYRNKTGFILEDPKVGDLGAPRWPASRSFDDPEFGRVEVYFDLVEIPITLARKDGAARDIDLRVNLQGCQLDGICYPPMTRILTVSLPAASAAELAAARAAIAPAGTPELRATDAAPAPAEGSADFFADSLRGGNRAFAMLVFLLGGIGLAFTPCVFPMVPILSGIVAGAGAGDNLSTRRAFVLSLVYVLASALVFTIVGVIAGLASQNLQALFQKPWILSSFALVFVALALSMFGFYDLQLPSRWQTKLTTASNRVEGGSLTGVAIMGVLSALIVGPCSGPLLAGAVVYISQTRDPIFGGLALFSLGLGMGLPLLAFGTGAGHWMPRAGRWMELVKVAFGVAFLWLAIWMLERILAPGWVMFLAGILLVGKGVHLHALERLPENPTGWQKTWKAIGLIFVILGVLQFIGMASGARDWSRPLENLGGSRAASGADSGELRFSKAGSNEALDAAIAAATASGKPVLFDFYADWCIECKRMERSTFRDTAVIAAVEGFVLIKADVTEQSEAHVALQQRFGIIGPPATLFFDVAGKELRGERLIGYEDAPAFAARLRRAGS